jgi:CHAT domain-containing protein
VLSGNNAVIHIATYGFINEDNHNLSALTCCNGENNGADLLYANDIRNEKVKADLVVLSSCESGLRRKVGGEGLIALNPAFIYADARNVISSLWKINDRYSSEFMINFHQEVVSGQSYTNALRQTKLRLPADPATAQPRF